MSRTDKTRPFWVKVNDHGVEHHDHSRLGEKRWRTRTVKDENGETVFEEVPFYHSVGDLLNRPEGTFSWAWLTDRGLNIPKRTEKGEELRYWRWNRDYVVVRTRSQSKMIADAMWLRAHGHPDTTVVEGGYYRRPKEERVLWYIVPDHCTIDEKPKMHGRWNANPCYMEADWYGVFRDMYKYSCSCCSPRGYNGASRATARDTLKAVTKAYNSGEDDYEDLLDHYDNITPRRKAGQSWW
ncbi:hypothetical protein SEA_CECE_163 [Microbacterium phage Cece]|nr:hypothetical protein SEA_CECE_163 [Microbacterium phage Cece]